MERQYHARPVTVGGERGFVLLFEDGGELVEVPEASFVLFDSEDDALAFADRLEHGDDDQLRFETETGARGSFDDSQALASAGLTTERIEYRGFVITYDPPPIPTRDYDWQWMADDYDGAYDSTDTRAGRSCSLMQAKVDIDNWYVDLEWNEQLRFETEAR